MSVKKTVNIIGSGIGGLVSAAYLIKNGFRVKVFERLYKPGGVADSFFRKGYFFETTNRQFCEPEYIERLYKLLGMEQKPLLRKEPYLFELLYLNSTKESERYILPTGVKTLHKMLETAFPHNKKGLDDFFKLAADAAKEQRNRGLSRLKEGFLPGILGNVLHKTDKNSLLNSYKELSYSELLDRFGFNPRLKSILSQFALCFSTAPEQLPALPIPSTIDSLARSSPYLFEKGSRQLIQDLVDYIENEGGHIYCKNGIESIKVKDGRITSLIDLKGREHTADLYISNICSHSTMMELIDAAELPEEYLQKVQNINYSTSSFLVYIGLPFSLDSVDSFDFSAQKVIFNYTKDINRAFHQEGTPSKKSNLIMSNYSQFNKSPQKSSLVLRELDDFRRWKGVKYRGEEYKRLKAQTQELILDKFEAATGLAVREQAEVLFSASPLTNKFFMSNRFGENRASTLPSRTPLDNLFLTGHYSGEGSGLHQVVSGGVAAARQVVEQSKKL